MIAAQRLQLSSSLVRRLSFQLNLIAKSRRVYEARARIRTEFCALQPEVLRLVHQVARQSRKRLREQRYGRLVYGSTECTTRHTNLRIRRLLCFGEPDVREQPAQATLCLVLQSDALLHNALVQWTHVLGEQCRIRVRRVRCRQNGGALNSLLLLCWCW